MISNHLTQFAGHHVYPFLPKADTHPPGMYRISVEWDETADSWKIPDVPDGNSVWAQKFALFLANPTLCQTPGIVVGMWVVGMWHEGSVEEPAPNIDQLLVDAADKLPNVHAIFYGDITQEESEISWIQNSNIGAIFPAYPALTHFGVRGGNGLRFGRIDHANLTHFQIETGGLNRETVHDILQSNLPNLTHLELYIGTEEYGRTTELDDLAPLLTGDLFPKLRYLGLRNAEIADEIAAAIVNSPILDRIETLDLSWGTLSDAGGRALLNSQRVRALKTLDLHRNYLSHEMITRLQALPIAVNASDTLIEEWEQEEWRFVAVGE